MSINIDIDLRQAMQTLSTPVSTPIPTETPKEVPQKTAKPPKNPKTAKPSKPKWAPQVDQPAIEPIVVDNAAITQALNEKGEKGINPRSQITTIERKFIETYLTGNMNMIQAMQSVGYSGLHDNSLYRLGRRIIQKYEQSAGDHKKIFRAVGAGELAVAKGLLELARGARSEMVRLNAWQAIAKCLGLQKDVVDVQTGINIVFNATQPSAAQDRPQATATPQSTPKPLPRAISILK